MRITISIMSVFLMSMLFNPTLWAKTPLGPPHGPKEMISIAKRHLEERGTDIKRYGDIRARLDEDKDVWIITFSRQPARPSGTVFVYVGNTSHLVEQVIPSR